MTLTLGDDVSMWRLDEQLVTKMRVSGGSNCLLVANRVAALVFEVAALTRLMRPSFMLGSRLVRVAWFSWSVDWSGKR